MRGNRHDRAAEVVGVGSIPARAGEPTANPFGHHRSRVYPRECGGTARCAGVARPTTGLSPRVRGNLRRARKRPARLGSIPASAGEPALPAARPRTRRVYPRECGGTVSAGRSPCSSAGLSPRVRGNPSRRSRTDGRLGSIPASAGEPRGRRRIPRRREVYPRECGGTIGDLTYAERAEGLSPRVRGNPRPTSAVRWWIGSIPASAGEPDVRGRWRRGARVYPRECGGTPIGKSMSVDRQGLSPRVRGNREVGASFGGDLRSIPASAGEPEEFRNLKALTTVYPRECGGTGIVHVKSGAYLGLSPRVRGNPGMVMVISMSLRSIPASAGEPCTPSSPRSTARVYPRECGGTEDGSLKDGLTPGLSPRVRGNLDGAGDGQVDVRSIPASAGEPRPAAAPGCGSRVYPRECGGTTMWERFERALYGLSPRVRGNLRPPRRAQRRSGSIPASAGEPDRGQAGRINKRVYPRECGGTDHRLLGDRVRQGLSPRVRGNRCPPCVPPFRSGSIPASAGEPTVIRLSRRSSRVYPRECGGTPSCRSNVKWSWGLSPRVRGNPDYAEGDQALFGSIPASAGEPSRRTPMSSTTRVYPRECGGTLGEHLLGVVTAGLSPRVRGNPEAKRIGRLAARSIPASAGEPGARPSRRNAARVYPRECGGTRSEESHRWAVGGLSPRVRGNPESSCVAVFAAGSIPASAGEPSGRAAPRFAFEVYPRECGGTAALKQRALQETGLSPRVRGNPPPSPMSRADRGSIPASAGEPVSGPIQRLPVEVYPRECGGTRVAEADRLAELGLSPRVRGNLRQGLGAELDRGLSPRVRGNRGLPLGRELR